MRNFFVSILVFLWLTSCYSAKRNERRRTYSNRSRNDRSRQFDYAHFRDDNDYGGIQSMHTEIEDQPSPRNLRNSREPGVNHHRSVLERLKLMKLSKASTQEPQELRHFNSQMRNRKSGCTLRILKKFLSMGNFSNRCINSGNNGGYNGNNGDFNGGGNGGWGPYPDINITINSPVEVNEQNENSLINVLPTGTQTVLPPDNPDPPSIPPEDPDNPPPPPPTFDGRLPSPYDPPRQTIKKPRIMPILGTPHSAGTIQHHRQAAPKLQYHLPTAQSLGYEILNTTNILPFLMQQQVFPVTVRASNKGKKINRKRKRQRNRNLKPFIAIANTFRGVEFF